MNNEPGIGDRELLGTLRRTNERLEAMVQASIERILVGSEDRSAMETAYAALRGEATAAQGVEALRVALTADGIEIHLIDQVEALYLNALVGV